MIKTSMQLKALVRNQSKGDSMKSQLILRNYVMERFLERVSMSKFRENFVLKGGAYIASILGIQSRSTMDMDATLVRFRLDETTVRLMIEEIIGIALEDHIEFSITSVTSIMGDFDYPGIRVVLNAMIDSMRVTMKLDLSTGDAITPGEIEYNYELMFEERSLSILAYSIETVLAEKFETIISRGTANSRMRDFYDIHRLTSLDKVIVDRQFSSAVENTSKNRGTYALIGIWKQIIDEISVDEGMKRLWDVYSRKFEYAQNISWSQVIQSVRDLGNLLS